MYRKCHFWTYFRLFLNLLWIWYKNYICNTLFKKYNNCIRWKPKAGNFMFVTSKTCNYRLRALMKIRRINAIVTVKYVNQQLWMLTSNYVICICMWYAHMHLTTLIYRILLNCVTPFIVNNKIKIKQQNFIFD